MNIPDKNSDPEQWMRFMHENELVVFQATAITRQGVQGVKFFCYQKCLLLEMHINTSRESWTTDYGNNGHPSVTSEFPFQPLSGWWIKNSDDVTDLKFGSIHVFSVPNIMEKEREVYSQTFLKTLR